MHVLAGEATFDPKTYQYDDSFKPGNPSRFGSVHTVPELMACLETQRDVEASGIFLEANRDGVYRYRNFKNKAQIQEAWKKNSRLQRLREARFHENYFQGAGSNAGLVGDDFVPLLGGPFNKQPYLTDYLAAHAYCFHEYHHHPLARAIIHITRDFVLGRGFRIDSDDEKALAIWHAFAEVNRFDELMEDLVKEGSTYGENLIWWLPQNQVYIGYKDRPGQEPQMGLLPRIRLIDPSTCWEIVTYPEDITRVLYYQLVFPTQYQIFQGRDAGEPVPGSKFVMQQLPPSDVMHFKYNCMSNEKRGRSDLFPVLGYLKWVRDAVNYKLIALKKQAAWTEDIIVEGSQVDVDNLSQALKSLGEFEPAGSRFIHTNKITRQYLTSAVGSAGRDESILEGISMIAAGVQIPVSYFGLSISSGQTKASAIVGTEPVAKKMERRQQEVTRIIRAIWTKLQNEYGVKGAECEITFPEIITQDRSAAIKDIKFIEDCGYISRETAAPLAAKEFDLEKYDWDQEKEKIAAEESPPIEPTLVSPLTAPGATASASPKAPAPSGSSSAVTSQDRAAIHQDGQVVQ